MIKSLKSDIAIFFWESYISVSPTIINMANAFGEMGHKVYIFVRNVDCGCAPETKWNEHITVVTIDRSIITGRFLNLVTNIPAGRTLVGAKFLDRIIFYDVIRQSKTFLKNHSSQYDCIGVDSIGLVWAARLLKRNSLLYYLSLELLCKDVISNHDTFLQWIKKGETVAHKSKVKTTIIQDKYRLNILERENNINLENRYSIITNSPRENTNQRVKDSFYFNEKFKLQEEVKKILMAGMTADQTMSLVLAKTFNSFKNRKVKLIFHERQKKNPDEPYFKRLRQAGGENLYLSLTPLPYAEIYKVYTSAHIGLVFYDPSFGDNYSYVVGASGKLSHYLMYGLPVISNNLPGFKELFEKYNIGFVLDDITQLESAVERILSNYKFYSENAYKCYLNEYNFDAQFGEFYQANYQVKSQIVN